MEDRISSLPDSVLVHILSFLDTRQAVVTGILSSRWRGLWTSVPSLNFDQHDYKGYKGVDLHEPDQFYSFDFDFGRDDPFQLGNADEFIKFVERSLVLHVAPKIHKFRLCFDYSFKFDSFMDAWILSAVRRDVKELELEFPLSFDALLGLPSWFFKCESLVSLSLHKCLIGVPNSVRLTSLRALTITWVRVEVEAIPALLAGCPRLEELVLEACECVGLVRICSPSSSGSPLKHLTVMYCSNGAGNEIALEIQAPNLEVLNLSGFKVFKNSLRNMLSLREAYLGFYFTRVNSKFLPVVESWLKDIHHVKVLKLSSDFVKVLSIPGVRQPPYSSKTKCLVIESKLGRSELPGIANLLWRFHDLESLIIKLIPGFVSEDLRLMEEDDFVKKEDWELLKSSFPCMVHRLKFVKISGFMERQYRSNVDKDFVRSFFKRGVKEIELVKILLTNAVALEKMTVQFCGKPDPVNGEEWKNILLTTSQKLTAIPRASSCAELFLSYK